MVKEKENLPAIKSVPSEILKIVYADLAHPSVKLIGKSLGVVLEFLSIPLLKLELLNEKSKALFKHNLETYCKSLKQIPKKKRIEVPFEIGKPIIDKLRDTQDKTLSEYYCNLLASASSEDTIDMVHPYFINIVKNLSPDEAILLKNIYIYLKDIRDKYNDSVLPCLHLQALHASSKHSYKEVNKYYFSKHLWENLQFPNNFRFYFENLINHGLFNYIDEQRYKSENLYQLLHNESYEFYLEKMKKLEKEHYIWSEKTSSLILTYTGEKFFNALNLKKY
jgi:hypothetical protein